MSGRLKSAVIFIVGPTATGKTRLSVKLAKCINGEIISADSMQVYKGMRISSQAPGFAERSGIRHYLVSTLDPSREYNISTFRKKATEIVRSIIRRGKVPIVVGGSGLYIKALVDGLFPSPEADIQFRKKTERFIRKYSSIRAHEKLAAIDPESAAKIHPNDVRRIIRALEIYHTTGRTMTELKADTKGLKDEFRTILFGLIQPREDMYRLIEERVEKMFASGIIIEVKKLLERRLSKTSSAVLGLKEVAGYLRGEYDLTGAKDLLKMNTRRFAKRQLTWFGSDRRIKWIDMRKVSGRKALSIIMKGVK
ncbi:MAG: tRNA (adenosine(37)-N6)-dimethylallyltransferase MiaA [Candidatus Omnitrophica bacterium]|nr:tRNA (adenosine(37)-N6)-dimethylallyltransferase MiaA [Candidatus Omnitrophota bacterium]